MMNKRFEFKIHSQLLGGKNHVMVTRTGHRYPNPKFAKWRDQVVHDLKLTMAESKDSCVYFDVPCLLRVYYWAGDKRRRDVPAMLDGLFHCFERAGLVKDDCLFKQIEWFHYGYDKDNPRAEIKIEEML